MDISAFEASLLADDYTTVAHIHRAAGYSLDEHAHPFDACAFITEGAIMLTINGCAHTYQAGEIFQLATGTSHVESAAPDGVHYLFGRREALA